MDIEGLVVGESWLVVWIEIVMMVISILWILMGGFGKLIG
jgi:hypothetical protein